MKPIGRRCCGIDVHKESVTVCVLPPPGKPEMLIRKRVFRIYTRELKQLRTWLKNCLVTENCDGIDRPALAGGVECIGGSLREADSGEPTAHQGSAGGHKTDPKDADWIANLLETGKLKGSFVPARPVRELRDFTRQRVHLLEDLNRVEQLCQAGNIKISGGHGSVWDFGEDDAQGAGGG
jgi:transposase